MAMKVRILSSFLAILSNLAVSGETQEAKFIRAPKPLLPEAVTTDWPNLLGPGHAPISPETHLLHNWPSNGLQTVWTIEKGESYTAPIVASNRVYLFHRVDDEEVLDCLDANTGKRHWRFAYPTRYEDRYGYNVGPRASPLVVGLQVYIFGAEGKLHAVDTRNGKKIWSRDLHTEYKVRQNFFGVGASPVHYGSEIIVQLGAPDGTGILAVDQATGRNRWRIAHDWGASYATPVIARMHGADRLLVFAGGDTRPPVGGLISVNLNTRKTDFVFPYRCSRYESVNAASPLVAGDDVFISYSIHDNGTLLRTRPDGGVTNRWDTQLLGAYWMTPVLQDGYIYGIGGEKTHQAQLCCFEVATGKLKWSDIARRGPKPCKFEAGNRRSTCRSGVVPCCWRMTNFSAWANPVTCSGSISVLRE